MRRGKRVRDISDRWIKREADITAFATDYSHIGWELVLRSE
jgi:hypothetical protein